MENNRIIAIGCDHAGYLLKEKIKEYLIANNYDIKDFGTNSEESVDYPDIAHALSKSINDGIIKTGILICGSGIGVSIVANKYDNVRAALCWKKDIAMFSRMHNNANVLCLPARFIEDSDAIETLQVFMKTEFEGGRHERRVEKINKKL